MIQENNIIKVRIVARQVVYYDEVVSLSEKELEYFNNLSHNEQGEYIANKCFDPHSSEPIDYFEVTPI